MNWYYSEDGQQRGPVDEEELQALIVSGTILPDTLLWKSGMAEWKPLTAITEFSVPPPLPQEFSPSGSPLANVAIGANVSKPVNLSDAERTGPAWEQRKQDPTLGFFKAIFQTISGALFLPALTFTNMKRVGGLLNPWLFCFIVMTVSGCIGVGYQLMTPHRPMPESAAAGNGMFLQFIHEYNQMLPSYGIVLIVMLILTPIFAALFPFVAGGICHLFLKLFSGANRSFETTFRVFCYAFGAAAILQIIPFCGSDIYPVWGIVIAIIGLAKAHDTSPGKSAGALLAPLLVCCCTGALLFAIAIRASGALQGLH